jgi:tetratricopeptide (TPR) repeat protein
MFLSDLLVRSRRLPHVLVVGVVLVLATAAATALRLLETDFWLQMLVALLIAGCGIAIEVDKALDKKRSANEKRAEEAAAEAARVRALRQSVLWPAPQLSGADPCLQLGVATSELARRFTKEARKISPYVERDVDRNIGRRLQSDGMVLLIGAPASGVTRTAYEMALRVRAPLVVLTPLTPTGLSTALEDLDVISRLERNASVLLWLDRIDSFTDLTPGLLHRLKGQSPGSRVVATISSTHYEVWAAENRPLAGAFGDPVRLERLPSESELRRASETYPGVDFTEGIAAAFTVTAAMLARKHGGFHECPFEAAGDECALARAVVDAVLDWSYTDIDRPLSMDELRALVSERPPGRRGIDDDHWKTAVQWATGGVLGGSALITRTAGGDSEQTILPATQIAEIHRAEVTDPDEFVWSLAFESAVRKADSTAIGRIGFRAHTLRYNSGAARAWAAISSIDEPATIWLREAASFSNELGDPAAEVPPRQRFLELAERSYGPADIRVARALSDLGAVCISAGQAARASDLLQRALNIQLSEQGADPLDVAATVSRLSMLWIHLGKPAQARELLARVPRISLDRSPSDPQGAVTALTTLAEVHFALGDFGEARDTLLTVLEVGESQYGPDHPVVASTLSNLSIPLNALRALDESRAVLERALKIQEQKLNSNHLDIAKTFVNLGNVYVLLGEITRAREPFERALRIEQSHLDPDDLQIARTLVDTGIMWTRAGDPAKGRNLIRQALVIQETQLGANHPDLAPTLMHLSDACFDLNEFGESRILLERTQAIQETQLDPDHPDLARTLKRIAILRRRAGEPDDNVLPLLVRAMGILRRRFPDGHPLITDMRSSILRIRPDAMIFDDGRIAGGDTATE